MRTLVDANVVLRYMLRDDKNQFPTAERTIQEGAFLLPKSLRKSSMYSLASILCREKTLPHGFKFL